MLKEENKLQTYIFSLEGLDCPDCAAKIEKIVSQIRGVEQARVNFVTSTIELEAVECKGLEQEIAHQIRRLGYGIKLEGGLTRQESLKKARWRTDKRVLLTILSGVLLVLGFFFSFLPDPFSYLTIPFYLMAIIFSGYHIAWKGLYATYNITLDMNFLMSIAVVGAIIIGEWLEGALVIFLFSLAQVLESASMDRARKAIQSLMELSPLEALVRRGGREERVAVDEVSVGETIIIKPGEKIPLDGRVIKGSSSVNQAPITGESLPAEKEVGSEVYAGTINQWGSLEVEATHRAQDSTLSRIIHMVEEAQAQKAPTQSFVDTFARYYTPGVILFALLIFLLPPIFYDQPFKEWFYRALVLLVISCPCALVISTPVTIISGLTKAARHGVLIKGGVYLETVGKLKVIALDKTGTLTKGRPEVADVIPLNSETEIDILRIAAQLELRSEHQLAVAILKKASEEGITFTGSDGYRALPGRGAQAVIEGKTYYIGNHRLFEEVGLCYPRLDEQLGLLEAQGKTAVLLGDSERIIGIITLADTLRDQGYEAIKRLKQIGIEKTLILSGDNLGTTKTIAEKLGIDEYRAELLPQDKVRVVQELKEKYSWVGMVGDGVNDAPALAAANVGIAMGTAGSDTALETADIALMADDLTKLPFAMALSHKTLRIIKQNIAFSLLLKGMFLVLAFPGWTTLWMAVGADMGASLAVIFNGLRLLQSGEEL